MAAALTRERDLGSRLLLHVSVKLTKLVLSSTRKLYKTPLSPLMCFAASKVTHLQTEVSLGKYSGYRM